MNSGTHHCATTRGLHESKKGQYNSLQRTSMLFSAMLVGVVVSALVLAFDDPHTDSYSLCATSNSQRLPIQAVGSGSSISFSRFITSKNFKIVSDQRTRSFVQTARPSSTNNALSALNYNGAENLSWPPLYPYVQCLDRDSAPNDFGLPERVPMWRYTRFDTDNIYPPLVETPPHARLVTPALPRGVWLTDDTAVVEGHLTLHRTGRITFVLNKKTHPDPRLVRSVMTAIESSTCVPATALNGDRMDVSYRYRCIFNNSGECYAYSTGDATVVVKTD